MATSMKQKLAKHLECPICLEKFKVPKVLSCQHSYCKKCLERLVTRADRENYEVTCPECRTKAKVPGGDVSRLPTNFLLNNLLSLHDDSQPSKKRATCAKHDGETMKLFCQTCEQPICGDCTVFDHHGHRYLFMKDLFTEEKEKVLKIVQESREIISALESSAARFDTQELQLQESSLKVRKCIDSFIHAQTETLKAEGERLKSELQKSTATQEEDFHSQRDSLFLSLGCLKSSVEFIEQALSKGDEAAVLTTKSQLVQQLKQGKERAEMKPRDTVFYTLEINEPLDDETVCKMAHIRKHKEEYKLSTYGGNFGQLEETYVNYNCQFAISKTKVSISPSVLEPWCKHIDESVQQAFFPHNMPPAQNCALIRIKSPRSRKIHSSVIEGENDCFIFSHSPDEIGTYEIEVIVNSLYIQGSPFDWIVKEFVTAKNYMKMDDEY